MRGNPDRHRLLNQHISGLANKRPLFVRLIEMSLQIPTGQERRWEVKNHVCGVGCFEDFSWSRRLPGIAQLSVTCTHHLAYVSERREGTKVC